MGFKRRKNALLAVLLTASVLAGCSSRQEPETNSANAATSQTAPEVSPVAFTEITEPAGIRFKHNNGAFGLRFLPETMGSGVAYIDYNGDGYQDIFFVNGRDWTDQEVEAYRNRPWTEQETSRRRRLQPTGPLKREIPPPARRERSIGALYRNNRNGTFTDVTRGSGLDREMLGMGVAVGDYDNDGRPDLFVTAYNRNYLFRNEGNGRFSERADAMGAQNSNWSTSAAWLDYDKDGRLDLFVGEYVRWTLANDVYATYDGVNKGYTKPTSYEGLFSRLYRNEGRRFVDVAQKAGIHRKGINSWERGSALGVAICDYNNDQWPDIVVANDMNPNFLFRNNRNGTFTEVGVQAGIALGPAATARAGMGIDAAAIDRSGRESIVVGNFSDEMLGLFHQGANNLFSDIVPQSNLAQETLKILTFGCLFMDIDNDSWLDLFVVNGHINPEVDILRGDVSYAQRPLILRNLGKKTTQSQVPSFEEIGLQSGEALQRRLIGRGLASADIDLDGDIDVVISGNGHSPVLLRNESGNKNNAIRLVLLGTRSNRSAIGAVVNVRIGQDTLRRFVKSGSSYLSQSELPLTIGLARHQQCEVAIDWPSGKKTDLKDVAAGQILWINEDKGIIRQQSFTGKRN